MPVRSHHSRASAVLEEPRREEHEQHHSSSGPPAVLWILGLLLLGIPIIQLPNRGAWVGIKAFVMEGAGILLAVYIVSGGEWTWRRVRAALTAAPNLAIAAFLGWIGYSAAHAPLHTFARSEAMRHLGGGLIYFAVVYGLSLRRHLGRLVDLLALGCSLAAFLAFLNYSQSNLNEISGAFHNEQLLAAFLGLTFPLILMSFFREQEAWKKMATQVALVIVLAGLLVTQERSVWAATVLGTLVTGLLYFLYARSDRQFAFRTHQILIPALMGILAIGLFLSVSRFGADLVQRASTVSVLKEDKSLEWRLGIWSKAERMIRARPVTGWGVGSFPVQQALYWDPRHRSRSQREIVERGPSLQENAHNTYLQLTAEVGFVGLALYLLIFAAFFVTAFRALSQQRRRLRLLVLIGAIGGIVTQMISAIGMPSWEFPECSLFLWLVLGMGMAAAGVGERGRASHEHGAQASEKGVESA